MNDRIDAPGAHISTTELLARLVSFDTTSRNSNVPLIEFVSTYLDGFGVPYRISRNAAGDKANLHAIIGPRVAGGIALSGHVDVVPVDGQAWSADPFTLRNENGLLYGRGATDMKGFVASALAAVPDLLARKLARPVHLFVTYDEETDMGGARRLIADLAESGLRPELCVVGEPSSMQPILGHKGRLALRVTARGHTGHSSMPSKGVNAVHALGEAIAYIAAEQRRFAAEGPFDPHFDPPHTTPHIGTVQGGTILNIIPEHASFTMEWRTIPANDFFAEVERLRAHVATHIEPAMRAVDPATGFTIEVMDWIPGMALPADHELATLTKQVAGSNRAGFVSYGTEGGLYESAGMPTIVCGPGSIEQAHKADEWIAESQLAACDAFIRRLADRLAA
ncbi:MAG TPA: acetylornithine deacetylase [Acetobacteraceae bacterium]|jgi:acetylornithine deacetylase